MAEVPRSGSGEQYYSCCSSPYKQEREPASKLLTRCGEPARVCAGKSRQTWASSWSSWSHPGISPIVGQCQRPQYNSSQKVSTDANEPPHEELIQFTNISHTGSHKQLEPVNNLVGRVSHYLPNWEVLTQDQWVLQTVAGYHLDLLSTRFQTHMPHQMQTTNENAIFITTEVAELISKGAIVETQYHQRILFPRYFWWRRRLGVRGQWSTLRASTNLWRQHTSRWRAFISYQTSSNQAIGWPRWIWRMLTSRSQITNHFCPSTGNRSATNSPACHLACHLCH